MLNCPDFLTGGLHFRPYILDALHVEEIVTWSEVNSLLSSGLIDYPRIRVAAADNEYSRSYNGFLRYSFSERGERRPRLVPGVLRKAMRDGCAIIIDHCEAFFPGLKALTGEIAAALGCPAWANLYISPKGPSGFGRHFDDHDIVAIQIYGSKRWSIHAPTYHSPNRGDKSFYLPSPKGKPLMEHVLSAGDGLYLPFGYWHDVETISNISMHVTIGLDFARKLDAVKLISEELAKDRFFRDKIDYSMTEVEAREFKERLIDVIQDLDMERFLARLRERRLDKEPEFNLPTF
ncbi:cupin domain-containing protein [Ralstonia mojiangensis]|uniref:cupin domain-containing protein n=1 Tax=Ralstonia mojiangensis TaxID=2953895 RepID=UPI00209017F1|nr:cupin domain-containing protein [Ralstonia mojiangensis]MCO5412254.1 cupin domain-containing protein [Ralstonia mojiangensis]